MQHGPECGETTEHPCNTLDEAHATHNSVLSHCGCLQIGIMIVSRLRERGQKWRSDRTPRRARAQHASDARATSRSRARARGTRSRTDHRPYVKRQGDERRRKRRQYACVGGRVQYGRGQADWRARDLTWVKRGLRPVGTMGMDHWKRWCQEMYAYTASIPVP